MKRTNLFLMGALASSMLLSSCKDEVEEITTDQSGQVKEQDAGKVVITDTFSPLTPEENKEQLEDDGLAMVREMKALKNTTAIDASYAFATFLDRSAPSAGESSRAMTSTARVLGQFGKDQASTKDVFATMRGTNDEPESFQAIFDENVGIWSWNTTKQSWDFTKGGDMIVYNFPSREDGKENNAVYTIYAYEGLEQNHPYDYQGDLPTNIKADLTVDGQQQLSYTFTARYNAAGEPEDMASSLTIGTFEFAATVQNNTEKVGARYSLKNNGKSLLAFGAGIYGNFTAENIQAVSEEEDNNAGEVVEKGDAYFQVMNIVLAGNMDVKKFAAGYQEEYKRVKVDYPGGSYYTEEQDGEAVKSNAKLLNEALQLTVFYKDGSGKIADSEVYSYTESRERYNGEEYEYEYVDIKLIFEDESKADLDTYFGEGFDALIAEFEKFAEDVNEEFE